MGKNGERIIKVCPGCGKEFEVYPCRAEKTKFCSKSCSSKNSARVRRLKGNPLCKKSETKWTFRNCLVCGKEFQIVNNPAKKYCSHRCFVETVKGVMRPGKMPIVACKNCGKQFKPRHRDRMNYCSTVCKVEYKAKVRKEKENEREKAKLMAKQSRKIICIQCGKEVSGNLHKKYCSEKCRYEYDKETKLRRIRAEYVPVPLKQVECVVCGKVFETNRRKTCSAKCQKKLNKTTTHRKRARKHGADYVPVNTRMIFIRDGWICQICGRKTKRTKQGTNDKFAPTLDHRVPISKGGSHTYENVQCACRECNTKKRDTNSSGQMTLFNKINRLGGVYHIST